MNNKIKDGTLFLILVLLAIPFSLITIKVSDSKEGITLTRAYIEENCKIERKRIENYHFKIECIEIEKIYIPRIFNLKINLHSIAKQYNEINKKLYEKKTLGKSSGQERTNKIFKGLC